MPNAPDLMFKVAARRHKITATLNFYHLVRGHEQQHHNLPEDTWLYDKRMKELLEEFGKPTRDELAEFKKRSEAAPANLAASF